MRTRYYNPEVKRFINQDTILGSITNSQSLNRYAYVQGNSISLIDPFGMSPSAGNNAIGHTLLDFTGLIPGIGFVFDVANSVWYVAEGNYTMAALAAFSAIPGLGDAVSASKLATKGAKAAELCNIIKKIGYAAKVAENAGEFGINANNAYKDIKEGNVGIGTFASLFAAGLNAFGIYASVKRFNSISVNTGKVTDGVEGINKAEEKYHIGLGNDLDNYDYNKANKDYESIMSGGSSSKSGIDSWNMVEGGGTINGREYSQHAMERMAPDTPQVRAELSRRAEKAATQRGLKVGTQEYYEYCKKYVDPRNIPPSVIEDAISSTKGIPENRPDTFIHETADVKIIINSAGKVITVIPKW